MAGKPSDILFPVAGVSKITGYQALPPFTTPDMRNCRIRDVFEERNRGGSRPFLSKAFSAQLGSGNPVRLLDSVLTGQEVVPLLNLTEDFNAPLSGSWTPWTALPGSTNILPTITGGRAYMRPFLAQDQGALHSGITFNTTTPIELETRLWANTGFSGFYDPSGKTWGTRWVIAMGLVSDTHLTRGIVLTLTSNPADTRFQVSLYAEGTVLIDSDEIQAVSGNVVRLVYIPASKTIEVYLGASNNLVYTRGVVPTFTLPGDRISFGCWHSAIAGKDTTADNVGFDYLVFRYTDVASAASIAEPALVASSNGKLYYESAQADMTEVTGQNVDLASDRLLSSAEAFGQLYIADYGVRVQGTTGVYTASTNAFTDAAVSDWTTLGIDIEGDFLEMMSVASGSTPLGTYKINTVAAGSLTLDTVVLEATGTGITYRVVRGVKVFDYRQPSSGKLTRLTNQSTSSPVGPPVGCTLCAVWLDRLVLSGDPENPGDSYFSAQGDFTNWQEDTTDTSPVFGEFDTNTRIDEPVRALIPFSLDYMVYGAVDSIHVLRGNPVRGGTVDAITRAVGVIDKHAWCITPEGYLLVMTGDGLYVIDANATGAVPISRDRLPKDFTGLDTSNNDVQMEFDVRRNGVLIAVTPRTSSSGIAHWFDWSTKAFCPEEYQISHAPTAMATYVPSGESTTRLIFGGRDGYLRRHLESATDDDGEQVDSYVLIGPIALGGGGYFDGILREVIAQIGSQSDSVKVEVQLGKSIEAAFNAAPRLVGTVRAGKSFTMRPNLRSNCCFLRISSKNGGRWAFEQFTIARERLGKQRLLAV